MTRRRWSSLLLLAFIALAFAGSAVGARWAAMRPGGSRVARPGRRTGPLASRVVSLAPSVTQTLFAVGCGPRVVGVTRYCTRPEAACRLPKVGGYVTPNLEAILRLRPDRVVGTTAASHGRTMEGLGRMGVPWEAVDHGSLAGVLASMERLGRLCGRPSQAEALVDRIRRQIRGIQKRVGGLQPRSALIVFGRTGGGPGEGGIRQVFVAGRTGLYEEILRLAGGRNAYPKTVPAFPQLSVEGILSLDPDAIVELASDRVLRGESPEDVRRAWLRLRDLRAVRAGRVVVVTGGYGQVPGPRIFRLVGDVARALHPEAFEGTP